MLGLFACGSISKGLWNRSPSWEKTQPCSHTARERRGEGRTGRAGQDRAGQDRTGQGRRRIPGVFSGPRGALAQLRFLLRPLQEADVDLRWDGQRAISSI